MTAMRLWKVSALLLALLLVIGPLPRTARAELTIEDERKLGDEFLKAALRHLPLIQDADVVGYVSAVGQRVVTHLETHTFPYHFYVVDSGVINAFAGPAGHVFVNRGILELMDNEGELASILGHEIAHVQSRHIAERMARSQKLTLASLGGVLAGLLLGPAGALGQAAMVGSLAGSASLQLGYSRQNEEEADRKGLRYMEAAGYSGGDMVDMMRKMAQQSWQEGGRVPTYLSTHPGVSERVSYLASVVETRKKPEGQASQTPDNPLGFKIMQAKLFGLYGNPTDAEVRFRQWSARPEDRVPALYGTGLLLRRQGKLDEAAGALKQAIALRPDLPVLLGELGVTYFEMGQLDRAASVLQSALSLNPDQAATRSALGRTFLEQGKLEEARSQLAMADQLNDRLPSIHYYLGLANGRLNDLGEAHYHFGIHSQREGDWKSAMFHYQEALRFSLSPERQQAIRSAMKEVQEEIR
ncbi:MAG TPA: M48 family metalloprotease, partial [Syntrophobacteria bacterium]|nr:M48 family metalloprotease [Syntrophobacteria bacterium]